MKTTTREYSTDYYDYIESGSSSSAHIVVPVLLSLLPIKSVLDVGCGAGAWLRVWKQQQEIDRILGIDGDYVSRDALLIDKDDFKSEDLRRGFDLGERFDLACCLEVAEHIPEQSADALIQSLCSHADYILFSAATPGQAGTYHVNERPYSYWRDAFRVWGFSGYDCVRPHIAANPNVEPWYRYNMFLYARDGVTIPAPILETKVASLGELNDISPVSWRIRKWVFRRVPQAAVTVLSRMYQYIRTIG